MRILNGPADPELRIGRVTGRRPDGRYTVTVSGSERAADSPQEIAVGTQVMVRQGQIVAVGRLGGIPDAEEVAIDE